tara:strand:- start:1289 stop:2650 length:1362 start_codon:yes stop_codon:yes gene_type:complete
MDKIGFRRFLDGKLQSGAVTGFEPLYMPPFLYDFQANLVEWAVRLGRSAIFADCGLGKTPMQLVWAENVRRKTNRPVLILAPLAVASQTMREGEKFGIEVGRKKNGITVANYERLHHFDPSDYAGVVCDESSILKSFDGVRRAAITEFMRRVPYRLLCTATAAPNDYTELGTSSEALGGLGYTDMLGRFFVNDQNSIKLSHHSGDWKAGWRFKGHARESFWRWVCSWARAVRKPSDLGFDDGAFVLPEILETETIVKASLPREGMLFDISAIGFHEEREVRRRTIGERCEMAATMVENTGRSAVVWCHLNDEADALVRMIPDAKQISGADSEDAKEELFEAFRTSQLRVLVIKPKIGAFGLNWQHCAHVIYFASHSYEQYYQAVRRCWRFGQTRPVKVEVVRTEAEDKVITNLRRKAEAAGLMFSDLVQYMNDSLSLQREEEYTRTMEVPSWL